MSLSTMKTAKLRDKIEIAFREVPAVLLAFSIISMSSVYVHKPIKTADSNNSFATATKIFNHTTSWAEHIRSYTKQIPLTISFTAKKVKNFKRNS
jgi:hypothetical protein